MKFNFENKTFLLIENSENGTVNSDTVFNYLQKGNLVTADYQGGTIQYGKIIAKLEGNQLHMLYQCMTIDEELKAGKAQAEISLTDEDKIKLRLNWSWLESNDQGSKNGISEYLEQ